MGKHWHTEPVPTKEHGVVFLYPEGYYNRNDMVENVNPFEAKYDVVGLRSGILRLLQDHSALVPRVELSKHPKTNQYLFAHVGWSLLPDTLVMPIVKENLTSPTQHYRENGLKLLGQYNDAKAKYYANTPDE